ncbi:MAG TPA: S8 family serine peptidase [Casimicrobiaceae bacterium]|nr:S8 family serine peptidase [Casimicrobiaceae bacterium]
MRIIPARTLAALALIGGLVAATHCGAARPVAAPQSGELITPVTVPLGVKAQPVTVVVELSGDPVAVQQANAGRKLSKSEKNAIKAQLKGPQNALRGQIAGLGGTVLADYQSAINGLKVSIARDKVGQLATLPNVISVNPVMLAAPSNIHGIPLIGAPAVWDGPNGLHGEGVKIAIIDTGIDYTHANFGGPGTPADYTAAHAAETAPANPAYFGPGAPRVKGGTDLVGDSYNADPNSASYQPIPHPDPNPLDCNGHGSHTAGTAAGSGVLSTGATYTGPYNATTVSGNTWNVGPGVAPKADIYAVRVFGCEGSTDVVVDAINWAVDNDMDVISMSLGSDFGTRDTPDAKAATNAAKAGIIVVASAGNEGPSQYMVGSPSTADGAISVAANDPLQTIIGVLVATNPPTGTPLALQAINANNFNFVGPITGPLVVLRDNPATTTDEPGYIGSANEALGCSPTAFTFNGVGGGQIAVAERGTCARVAKAIFGQQAGAAAVIMANTAAGLPPFEGPITSNPDTGIPYTVTIPFVGVAGDFRTAGTDSNKLRASPAGTTATLSSQNFPNPGFEAFASFSSSGPRTADSFLKPDLTAPGVSIASTGMGTGNQAATMSGTSMSAPHVAGSAALLVQAYPTWQPGDLKAAMVNTGDPLQVSDYRTSRGGTGLVQPAKATKSKVVAHGDGGKFAVALNFGFQELKHDFNQQKDISLDNNGTADATFSVAQVMPQGSPHTVSFDKTFVTVKAHGHADVRVTLNVPAATAGASNEGGLSYQEVAGIIQFTPAAPSQNANVALNVPYLLVPRPRADISTNIGNLKGTNPSTVATVTNKHGVIPGDADFYAWGLQDNNDPGKAANDVRAVGVQSFDFGGGTQLLVFAVNTFNRWSNASTNEFDIYVDVDGDGIDDYVVVGADQGAVTTGTNNGLLGSFVFSTRSSGASTISLATAPTDSSIAELPIFSTQLCRTGEPCLSSANPRLTYHAVSFDILQGGMDVVKGSASFNPWTNAVSTGGFVMALPPGGTDNSVGISVNSAEYALTPPLGLMVITLDNNSGNDEAQLINVKPKK